MFKTAQVMQVRPLKPFQMKTRKIRTMVEKILLNHVGCELTKLRGIFPGDYYMQSLTPSFKLKSSI